MIEAERAERTSAGVIGADAREAHHRIANDLAVIASMVRLQAQSPIDPEGAKLALRDAASRIDAVARLHRTLVYVGADRVPGDFIKAICTDAASFAGAKGASVECRVDLAGADLNPEDLRTLGLVIHELVLNALKHAHPTGLPPRIDVHCRALENGAIAVDVCDDGVGLPEGFDADHDGGFGFKMVRQLAKQLNALIAFESLPTGLICSLRTRGPEAARP